MFLSAAVSMEDYAVMFGTWGKPGVCKILCSLKNAGVRRVYWRTLGAGQAPYPSRVTEPLTLWVTDETRHGVIDPATAKVLGIQPTCECEPFYRGASEPFEGSACVVDFARLALSAQQNGGITIVGPPPF